MAPKQLSDLTCPSFLHGKIELRINLKKNAELDESLKASRKNQQGGSGGPHLSGSICRRTASVMSILWRAGSVQDFLAFQERIFVGLCRLPSSL